MAESIISIKDFKDFVREGTSCILLKANGCKTSVRMGVAFDKMAVKYSSFVRFGKADVDTLREVVQYLKVGAVPEFIFYRNGQELTRKICTQDDELEKLIRKTADIEKIDSDF